ncbi:MAG: hypothetical protein QOD75_64 [Blastocatellia bacterium]|jgi:hypothetical protein|nr:hypothetical protein [Blastocatellia bacterium]
MIWCGGEEGAVSFVKIARAPSSKVEAGSYWDRGRPARQCPVQSKARSGFRAARSLRAGRLRSQ